MRGLSRLTTAALSRTVLLACCASSLVREARRSRPRHLRTMLASGPRYVSGVVRSWIRGPRSYMLIALRSLETQSAGTPELIVRRARAWC